MLSSSQVAALYGVHPNTIRRWRKKRRIDFTTTKGGHYRYTHNNRKQQNGQSIIYCRVSSAKQRSDLQHQVQFIKEKMPHHDVITDIGSGINFKRKGLQRILELALQGDLKEVVVAHRDRLCRFAFDLIEWILLQHNARIVVLNNHTTSKETQFTEHLLAIVHVFSCRLSGLRRYKRTKKKKGEKSEEEKVDEREGFPGQKENRGGDEI